MKRKLRYSFVAIACFISTGLAVGAAFAQQPAIASEASESLQLKVGLMRAEQWGAEKVNRFTISPLNNSSSEMKGVRVVIRYLATSKAKFLFDETPYRSEIQDDYRAFVWDIGAMPGKTHLENFSAVSWLEPLEIEFYVESATSRQGPWLIEMFSKPRTPTSLLPVHPLKPFAE